MIKANIIIDELRNLNYQFLVNDRNGMKTNGKNYIFGIGKIPIVLSAPHAVKQYREDHIKLSDYLTGPLTIYLAQKCNCSYFVRIFNDNSDPNFPIGKTLLHVDDNYLKGLIDFIKDFNQFLVIDIHGCRNIRQYDCSIWSDNYNTCEPQIIKIFQNSLNYFDLSVDNGSEYLGGQVTRQCSLIKNAFQIEIKKKIRTLKIENYYLLKSFIDSMEQSIYEIYNYYIKLEKENNINNKKLVKEVNIK